MPHRRTNRRGFLGTVGALPVLGMAAELPSHGLAAEQAELKSRSAAKRVSDQLESARLKVLDLNGPDVADKRKQMQEVKVPWIAFKVLAAGAISPADGFQYAFDGGADFLCVGMFDFQIEEDVELTRRSFAAAQTRRRPWG